MATYTISGTSNLLESNRCWDTLKDRYSLRFHGYGDLTSSLLATDEDGLIFVILLEDLLQNSDGESETIEKGLNSTLALIRQKAKVSTQPLVICFGDGEYENVVESVKRETPRRRLRNWLVSEFENLRDEVECVYFLNLAELVQTAGHANIFSERNWYFGRCRFSINGLKVLADNFQAIIERIHVPARKVLVLDCDNTIWGGVVGEDGLDGLVLGQDGVGQAFVDFQKEVIRLVTRGVIVVLASKNNEEDVWKVLIITNQCY